MLAHCHTEDELEAVKHIPQLMHKLGKSRYEPLNISRPNIRKKNRRGSNPLCGL